MEHRNYSQSIDTGLETPDLVSELFGRPAQEAPSERFAHLQQHLMLKAPRHLPPAPVARRFLERHQERLAKAQEHNLPTRLIGFTTMQDSAQIFEGPDCDWVVFLNIARDPAFHYYQNKLPIPPEAEEDFLRHTEAGLNFDITGSAHAVRKGTMTGRKELPVDLLIPAPPPKARARLRFLDRVVATFRQTTERGIRGIAIAGATLSLGALAVPALAASTLSIVAAPVALLDPILLGVDVIDGWRAADEPTTYVAAVYYLTHWYWTVEDRNA